MKRDRRFFHPLSWKRPSGRRLCARNAAHAAEKRAPQRRNAVFPRFPQTKKLSISTADRESSAVRSTAPKGVDNARVPLCMES